MSAETAEVASTDSLASLPLCRYCHDIVTKKSGPLLQPCKCKGSLAFAHQKCLKKWLIVQRGNYEEGWKVSLDQLLCEICLTPYVIPQSLQPRLRRGLTDPSTIKKREILCWSLLSLLTIGLVFSIALTFGFLRMDLLFSSDRTVAFSIWMLFASLWIISFFAGCYHMQKKRGCYQAIQGEDISEGDEFESEESPPLIVQWV